MKTANSLDYPWSPARAIEALGETAHPLCMVALRALMDDMWLSDRRFEVASPAPHIRALLGIGSEDWRGIVSQLFDAGLLVRKDRGLGDIYWQSPDLKIALEAHESRDQAARRLNERRERKAREDSMRYSLRRRVGGTAPYEPPVLGYLEGQEAAALTSAYAGWLPTRSFDERREVIRISESSARELQTKHPDKDVATELQKIFQYLMRRPGSRPASGSMHTFVGRWMSDEFQTKLTESLDSVVDQLEALPDFEEDVT